MNQTIPKKPPHKQSNTIDEKHTEMLNQFYENENEIIPKLLEEKTQLKSMISNLKEHEIDAYMDIRDKIHNINSQVKELKQQIENLKSRLISQLPYYLNAVIKYI